MMLLDNPNQKEVASIMEENKAIKKAIPLCYISPKLLQKILF